MEKKVKELLEDSYNFLKQDLKSKPDFKDFYPDIIYASHQKKLHKTIVKKHGTPYYFTDLNKLHQNIWNLKVTWEKYLPGKMKYFHPFKCNDLPIIAKFMKKHNFSAEVAGLYELKLALKLKFNEIMFTSPAKTEEELILAIKNNVILNIDSLSELRHAQIIAKRIKKTAKIVLRLNPGSDLMGNWKKFGIPRFRLKSHLKTIRNFKNLKLVGIHFHTSCNYYPDEFTENILKIYEIIKTIPASHLKDIEFFDIGGGLFPEGSGDYLNGFDEGALLEILTRNKIGNYAEDDIFNFVQATPLPKLDEFAEKISVVIKDKIFSLMPNIKLAIEPGRFLQSTAGMIVCSVLRDKPHGIFLDSGCNLTGDFKFTDTFFPIVNMSNPSKKVNKHKIFGPLCDPYDFFGTYYFGKKAKEGDVIAILNQGAYTNTFSRRFIKPYAKHIVHYSGKIILARAEETFSDRYGKCRQKLY